MAENLDGQPSKRPLKKVRRQFLNKTPGENDDTIIESPGHFLNPHRTYVLKPCLSLIEENRKIRIDTTKITSYFKISGILVQEHMDSKIVTVNLNVNQKHVQIPWEYTIKRLESYGDADMADWAKRLRNHYATYPKMMSEYYSLFKSEDPKIIANLTKAKNQAILAYRMIESKYTFKKIQAFYNKDDTEILSSSFSEKFLGEMGYTVESFVNYSKLHGLPSLCDKECNLDLDIARRFLDSKTLSFGPIQNWAEYSTFFYDKDGHKHEKSIYFVNIYEPTKEGVFVTGYFIILSKEDGRQLTNMMNDIPTMEEENILKETINITFNEI